MLAPDSHARFDFLIYCSQDLEPRLLRFISHREGCVKRSQMDTSISNENARLVLGLSVLKVLLDINIEMTILTIMAAPGILDSQCAPSMEHRLSN